MHFREQYDRQEVLLKGFLSVTDYREPEFSKIGSRIFVLWQSFVSVGRS